MTTVGMTGHSSRTSAAPRWTPTGIAFNAGSPGGRRWAGLLAAGGQLHGRRWAVSHGRQQRPRAALSGFDGGEAETPGEHFSTVPTRRENRISRRVRPASAESFERAQEHIFASKRSRAPARAVKSRKFDFRVEFWGPNPIFRPFQTPRSGFSRRFSRPNDFSVEALDAKIRHRQERVPERSENHFRVESRPRRRSWSSGG